jgi:hypothetical protein
MSFATLKRSLVLLVLLALASPATAGLYRAYLSSGGSDANPCTLQSPCRLLPAALAAIDSGGEVWILDSGNFNVSQVTMSKSVSILAVPGAVGSLVGNGGDALVVNGPALDISLRNLKFRNITGGAYGIHAWQVGKLVVDRCEVTGFGFGANGAGILVLSGNATIVDTFVHDNYQGIVLGGYTARATLNRVTVSNSSSAGIHATATGVNPTTVHVSDSVVNQSATGFTVDESLAKMTITRSSASNNTGAGFSASASGLMEVTASSSTHNAHGFVANGGTLVVSDSRGSTNAGDGAGVLGAGTLILSSSTFAGNVVGVHNYGSSLLITRGDNVISGNQTGSTGPYSPATAF